jgi:hypothetical protein
VNEQELEALVRGVTPERVRQLVLKLEPEQPAPNRGTVPLYAVLDALAAGLPLADAGQGSQVDMRLRKAVIAAVKDIPSMTFFEGDG